jgi:archaellin
MRVHADYAALRTIKLKSLQLDTQAGEQKTTKKTTITIKLKANDGSASPIEEEELTFTPTGEAIDGGLEFWSSTYGEQLTTDFKPFIGHFMPSGITRLSLTSIYDVYDTKGNLIRQNCKVTNSVLLSELFTGQSETERGKRYTINMTIQPTYLGMLSEPDLYNPTVVVN